MPTWVCSYGTLVEAAPSLADCTYILSVSLSDDFSRCFALLLVVGCAPLIARVFLPSSQRPLWQWRVVFMSRLGVTALDGLAKTKESDKVWYCLLLLMFLSSLLLLLLVAFCYVGAAGDVPPAAALGSPCCCTRRRRRCC